MSASPILEASPVRPPLPDALPASLAALRGSLLGALWARLQSLWIRVSAPRRERRLRLSESLALGEKRLLAVVEFEEQRFLVAATPGHITLLQALPPARPVAAPPSEAA
jgi:flagellar biogenesis protein FliO